MRYRTRESVCMKRHLFTILSALSLLLCVAVTYIEFKLGNTMERSYDAVPSKIAEIEAEMRRIGMWQADPLPVNSSVTSAFGSDTMTFEQWLQFIFIPRVKEIVAAKGPLPSASQVAAQAHREWKMWDDRDNVDMLLKLLRDFDAMFG